MKRSVRGEEDVLRAVQIVHTMIDREIASGTGPEDVFVFGLSQGGTYSTSRLKQAVPSNERPGSMYTAAENLHVFRCPEHSKRAALP